jgi:hypothetical protein
MKPEDIQEALMVSLVLRHRGTLLEQVAQLRTTITMTQKMESMVC